MGVSEMLFSGTTKDFHRDCQKLPGLVQQRLKGYWADWQALSHDGSRHHRKPADLEEKFANLSYRMGLRELTDTNGIYRCDIGLGYRALATRIEDDSGKQRLVWFWAGSHAQYDKLTFSGNRLGRDGANAEAKHRQLHSDYMQRRRVRIKTPAALVMKQAHCTRPKGSYAATATQPHVR